jgi:signal transduction histidine kinase
MKHFSALLAAFIITAIIGMGIMVVGVNALTNKNTVALQNTSNASLSNGDLQTISNGSTQSPGSDSSQIQQLQQQVNTLESQLNQSNQAVQQYQSVLLALQQRGVIRIDRSGNIYLPQGDN